MHHQKANRKLGRDKAARLALMRGLATSLVESERIQTTVPRAKELKRYIDRVITMGKKGTVAARRNTQTMVYGAATGRKVCKDLAERMAGRPGGYTRIIRLGARKGDNAEVCLIEFVDFAQARQAGTEKSADSE